MLPRFWIIFWGEKNHQNVISSTHNPYERVVAAARSSSIINKSGSSLVGLAHWAMPREPLGLSWQAPIIKSKPCNHMQSRPRRNLEIRKNGCNLKKWPLQCGDQWPLVIFLQNQKFERTKSRHFAQSSDCKIGIYGCGEDVCGDRITLCDNFSIPTFSEAWERLVPWP